MIKLRHVALALVGWYLIAPPRIYDSQGNATGKVSYWFPLSDWEYLRTFDTGKECKDVRADQISWLVKNPELGRAQSQEEQHRLDALREQLNLSQCVASGDGRLKEK
jgi:hypothetical protein